ncbi:MAG: efflux RND transporter periplasmic adaptor subunit [Neisseriaceae bacterium]|nr:efflux RND transporter periplasmic adaptor subunit [Neisseriaceae bacterium]
MTHIRLLKYTAIALATVAALTACKPKQQQPQGQAPVVSVIEAKPETVKLNTALTGRLEASRVAEVRARVQGVVLKRLFEEGSQVKQGQPLFLIDDAPYRAAKASAQAVFDKARADMNRMKPLMEAGAISRQEWDAIVQGYQVAKSNLETANINFSYAHVTAPISGRIGRAEVSEGALVSPNAATLMATIHQDNPLYINFTQSADEVMKMRRDIASGKITAIDGEIPVRVFFNDGTEYGHTGKLLFTDPTVNATTGQVSLRAVIPNPDNILFAGLFVSVEIANTEIPNAIVLPQQAVTRGQTDVVMIVNKDGSYAPRPVVVSGQQGNNWIITGGLNQGDKVIIDGMAVVQMTGAKQVKTKPWGVDMPPAGMPPQGQAGQGGQAGQPENNPQEQGQPENSSEQAQQGQPETENSSEQAHQGQPEQSENTEQPKS